MGGAAACPNMSAGRLPNGHHNLDDPGSSNNYSDGFRMPLHYPRYNKAEYEKMPEWRLDCLLKEYGLPAIGDADHKRKFAMGAFLWK